MEDSLLDEIKVTKLTIVALTFELPEDEKEPIFLGFVALCNKRACYLSVEKFKDKVTKNKITELRIDRIFGG